MSNTQQDFSTDLLRIYYGRLFPYESMYNWLSYDSSSAVDSCYFGRREWSFTIEDDIYIRYQSFTDRNEMMEAIQKRQPHKIDIGAVFSVDPSLRATVRPEAFKTIERELVFDVDMTDYDGLRTCCSGANICLKCWPFMTAALKVVDRSLREDFGFKNILWVYSGRRGIHCWVCDPEARSLPNEARAAVINYLTINLDKDTSSFYDKKSDDKSRNVFKHPIHPMLKRAYAIMEPLFERFMADETGQGVLGDTSSCNRVLNSLPDESIRIAVSNHWIRNPDMSGAQKWQFLKEAITPSLSADHNAKKRKLNYPELDSWRYELVFFYCYPRLDVNVSKAQNHLLKSPFCIHPKTGRVCVPIDPSAAEEFNPFEVPTLGKLCSQIDAFDKVPGNTESGVDDISKTELRAAISLFEKVFLRELVSSIRRDRKDKAQQAAAMMIEF